MDCSSGGSDVYNVGVSDSVEELSLLMVSRPMLSIE